MFIELYLIRQYQSKCMDIFGFKNQGINYDKFRPKYPLAFIEHYLKSVKHHNRYLDIATGTGQLLFAFAPHFQHSKGVDVSKTMIQTAGEKAQGFTEKYPGKTIELLVQGVMEIDESEKFDLVTVGQALHFFPIQDSLLKIKRLLAQDGKFVTFGYIFSGFYSKNKEENQIFLQFYKKVKPLFTFDRDDLHTHYSDKAKYPFEQVFPRVERQMIQVPLEMNKLQYLSYLKTMSGYNLYLEKHGEDPLKQVEEKCAEQVTCLMDYFRIECSLK